MINPDVFWFVSTVLCLLIYHIYIIFFYSAPASKGSFELLGEYFGFLIGVVMISPLVTSLAILAIIVLPIGGLINIKRGKHFFEGTPFKKESK